MRSPFNNTWTSANSATEGTEMKEAMATAPANSILAKSDPNDVQRRLNRLAELEAKEAKVKERYKKYGERHRATVSIMLDKAKKAGFKVTPAEVDTWLKANK
jgi:ABC-type uncharacterized transport system substrate-binding protein